MRRFIFYLAVAFLAFGISTFLVVKFFYLHSSTQVLIAEEIKQVQNTTESEIKETILYGCNDNEIELFWLELDKEKFLNFKREEIKVRATNPSTGIFAKELFEEEWEKLQEEFDCSYFAGIEKKIDLNNDGKEEILVVGEISTYHGEVEMLVFQKKDALWELILFDIGNHDTKIKESKSNGFFDIETKTSFSGGNRDISIFKFNGNNYEEKECFSENKVLNLKDETIVLNKAVITREKCFQEFSTLLK